MTTENRWVLQSGDANDQNDQLQLSDYANALCQLLDDPTCTSDFLRSNFNGSGEEQTADSGIIKEPGDRVRLATDVCPVSFVNAGMDLEASVEALESNTAFKSWMEEIRIPEECTAYRLVLNAQTIEVEGMNNGPIEEVMNNLRYVLRPLSPMVVDGDE